MDDVTTELPILELTLTRKLRPMIMGSLSGWLIFAGIMARPRATSERTNFGIDIFPDGDKFHFGRDFTAFGIVHLRDIARAAQDGFAAQIFRDFPLPLTAGHKLV